jgi:hypothetical protein
MLASLAFWETAEADEIEEVGRIIYLIILYRGPIFPSTVRSRSITSPSPGQSYSVYSKPQAGHLWFVHGPSTIPPPMPAA